MTLRLIPKLLRRCKTLLRSVSTGRGRPGAQGRAPHAPGPSSSAYGPDAVDGINALFAAGPHRSGQAPQALAQRIQADAAPILAKQPGYQPVYGDADAVPGQRTAHLERNVELALEVLGQAAPRHQPRIVDVGCNLGYVSLRLAESFPNVIGLEVSKPHLALCRLLADKADSPARFFGNNALDVLGEQFDGIGSTDVVLLYNVVHQFIFHQGIDATRDFLGRLARNVDTLVVELARQEDYVKHGLNHLLPADPGAILSACEGPDISIRQVHAQPRPVYVLQRKTLRIGQSSITPSKVDYSVHPDPGVSRKYFTSPDRFAKVFRFTLPEHRLSFEREVAALGKLKGSGIAPEIIDWQISPHTGGVLMSFVGGHRLTHHVFNRHTPLSRSDRAHLTAEYLHVAHVIHQRVGYQNDLQPHNMILDRRKRLIVVDYEQATAAPVNDPFGLLLWSIFDLWGGRDPGRAQAIRSLRLDRGTEPVYPDFTGLDLPEEVRAMTEAARQRGAWGPFLADWTQRLPTRPGD